MALHLQHAIEEAMTKVPPFFSTAPTSIGVYHMSSDCDLGQQIPAKHRREGKRNRFRCHQCKSLLDGTKPVGKGKE